MPTPPNYEECMDNAADELNSPESRINSLWLAVTLLNQTVQGQTAAIAKLAVIADKVVTVFEKMGLSKPE